MRKDALDKIRGLMREHVPAESWNGRQLLVVIPEVEGFRSFGAPRGIPSRDSVVDPFLQSFYDWPASQPGWNQVKWEEYWIRRCSVCVVWMAAYETEAAAGPRYRSLDYRGHQRVLDKLATLFRAVTARGGDPRSELSAMLEDADERVLRVLPSNDGPTTRLEIGQLLEICARDLECPNPRKVFLGGPEGANTESARMKAKLKGLRWYTDLEEDDLISPAMMSDVVDDVLSRASFVK